MKIEQAMSKYKVELGSSVDLSQWSTDDKSLFDGDKEASVHLLEYLQDELKERQQMLYSGADEKLLVVIQAMDTGGKDGTVKKVFAKVDPQGINVTSFKKPTAEELAHDFLWRIHKHVPPKGMVSVFNRSHYEDIIAVRVKKIFSDDVWQRRYRHIVEFERMLAEEGTKIVKIFLHISKGEQKKRLQARLDDSTKHWKFNPDDLKDRAKWDEFMGAYGDLIERTNAEHAPWYIVPADSKWYRNIAITQILCSELDQVNMSYPTVDWDAGSIVID